MTAELDCIYDVIGIGFGPANVAVAVAAEEERPPEFDGGGRLHMRFFERQPEFGWHRGMLIEGATMQVAFFKDLATMRNPQSRFTFVSYLHAMGRLPAFVNSKTIYPLRLEFHDYMAWVARNVASSVDYGSEVVAIAPVVQAGLVQYLDVHVRVNGVMTSHRTRNVLLATGLDPRLPAGIAASEKVWHTSDLLRRANRLERDSIRTIVVVGAGQSAAESVEYLYRRFPAAVVHAVHSRYGYTVADDSPFANGIFDPEAVEMFYSASADVKDMLLCYHGNTNYSVVDPDLSRSLYMNMYEDSVLGTSRLIMRNVSRVSEIVERDRDVRVAIEHLPSGAVESVDADIVVYATGYNPADVGKLLSGVAGECKHDAAGRLALDRDYRVVTSESMRCGIYVQGPHVEYSHGLSAGLLSNVAVRAGEIVSSIRAKTEQQT